ncbi:hypothetical protein BBP40_005851 [Aspergillus hancockii]|nr:hypothetical protein BBP40_005851 [Aspergillus hancockii]
MATLHLGSKTWVFLNSHRVVQEIIAKRGRLTNGRSRYPVASDIVSRKGRSLILPPEQWSEKRRVMHHLLSGTALKQYGEFQELESTQHLVNTQRIVAEFTRAIGASRADWIPMLAEIPVALQCWRPYWERIGQFHYDVYRTWWDPVKKKIDEGTAPPSFARDGLLHPDARFSGDEQEAMLTQDIEFEGYSFPAGTCFAINETAVGYECENPAEFIPERWLNGKEMDITHELWQFGGGRRVCVGYKLAQRSLFLNIARLAYCFNYAATGPIDSRHMNYESTDEPFPAIPTVRSEAHAKLIFDEGERLDVIELAKQPYEDVPSWGPAY